MSDGIEQPSSGWAADKARMLLAAFIVIALGLTAFAMAGSYNIDFEWVLLGLVSLSFIPGMAWSYREKFRSPAF